MNREAPTVRTGYEAGLANTKESGVRIGRWCLAVAAILACLPARAAPDLSRDVLWVALQGCLLNKRTTGRAFPCLSVDPGERGRPGTAVLRAPGEPTHLVVMPTDDVVGVEAPALQTPKGAFYWGPRSRPGARWRRRSGAGGRSTRSGSRSTPRAAAARTSCISTSIACGREC